ncbi:gamma-glutamyltransferase [Burkholderia lata]|uniref:Gamma-glutamyltransferase n=1 Tax=Burkholderia lata (strain ATCC 17760 / DSM 23089 / LMG 22485 / NCIMB 9086 / R18194 / 383) TaxID=482957 RepID=A0A6P2T088_BURL3|nr:gamma-glutamyltransferase [Burkholderia lata]VWC51120.1 gamma-glutamyltransferase [Burkholderia lata]
MTNPKHASATLAPSAWPQADQDHWWAIQQSALPGNPPARGDQGAVATALHALATRVGLEALRQGGSAVDAALATALTQIVLGGGAVISFFGILNLMHHDAASGETTSLNASWNTVLGEDDPMSIPGALNAAGDGLANMQGTGEPSGRTALVGGFMRGLEEAHRRYGKLPFARLFEAAIELAEEGFPVSPSLARYIAMRQHDLARLPETRAIFYKPDGSTYVEGDLFRQPALAETLRRIAAEGADYMYTGAWAARCIAAIQADGGKMTGEDLARYRPVWSSPVTLQRGDRTLALLGEPSDGSVNLVEALNLATAAGLTQRPHWSRSGDSLVRIAKCCAAMGLFYNKRLEQQQAECPGGDASRAARLDPTHADRLWARLENEAPITFLPRSVHSDDVVAIDADGNMVALCHSINCLTWGRTAIVVDGVSVGDPASYMQPIVAATPRGAQLANPIELGLILKNGQPEIAWSSMGVGLHYQTTMSLLNVIDHGMTIEQAADAPRLLLPIAPDGDARKLTLRVIEGEFPDAVLDETGLDVKRLAPADTRFAQGLWVAIQRDTESGALTAISPSYTNGQAAAF